MRVLYINKFSFITCPRIDEQNDWSTIVYNPATEEILKINKTGYFILKKIEDTPGITRQELSDLKYFSFVEQMIKANVIIEKTH